MLTMVAAATIVRFPPVSREMMNRLSHYSDVTWTLWQLMDGGFHSQMVNNTDYASMPWRHHGVHHSRNSIFILQGRQFTPTVYPKKYAHGFVLLCFVVVVQSFIMNSHEVFIHIHQGCFAGTGAIVRLPQCQWSKPDGYGKISQCITTTKHSKAKTVCIFLGIYCMGKITSDGYLAMCLPSCSHVSKLGRRW